MQDLQTEIETKVRLVIMSSTSASVNTLIKFEWKTVRGLRTAAKGATGRETERAEMFRI